MRGFVAVLLLMILVAAGCRRAGLGGGSSSATQATGPLQPSGMVPGGSGTVSSGITQKEYGSGVTAYWLFEPANPAPANAPVIVLNHGWGAMSPGAYGAWIQHIVQRGNIVIYPEYQDSLRTLPSTFTNNALAGIKAAVAELNSGSGHVKPDWSKFAILGHSMGGVVTANEAALAQSSGLPVPKAIMSVAPGKTWTLSAATRIDLANLSGIPSSALMLVVVGADDKLVKDVDGKKIFSQITQIPIANKDFITVQSDSHGIPALVANHFAPTGPGELIKFTSSSSDLSGHPLLQALAQRRIQQNVSSADSGSAQVDITGQSLGGVSALDYYGYWKLFDGLTDAAFYGKNRDYALGNTQNQTFMGTWSDGTPVKPLLVTTNP